MSTEIIKVCKVADALKWLNTNPENPLTIYKDKGSEKAYAGGTMYYPVKLNLPRENSGNTVFSFTNVSFRYGPTSPNDPNNMFGIAGAENIDFNLPMSQMGDLGKFVTKLDEYWMKEAETKLEAGFFPPDPKKSKPVRPLVTTHYSIEHNKTKGGQPREDPLVKFRVEFSKYPMNYGILGLKGKQKTRIYDARTAYKDQNGRIKFKDAVHVDDNGNEYPLNPDTFCKWIADGGTIISGKVEIKNACRSKTAISLPLSLRELVIMPPIMNVEYEEKDTDEIEEMVSGILTQNKGEGVADAPVDKKDGAAVETTIPADELIKAAEGGIEPPTAGQDADLGDDLGI